MWHTSWIFQDLFGPRRLLVLRHRVFNQSLTHSINQSIIHSFNHSFIQSFIYSFIQSYYLPAKFIHDNFLKLIQPTADKINFSLDNSFAVTQRIAAYTDIVRSQLSTTTSYYCLQRSSSSSSQSVISIYLYLHSELIVTRSSCTLVEPPNDYYNADNNRAGLSFRRALCQM